MAFMIEKFAPTAGAHNFGEVDWPDEVNKLKPGTVNVYKYLGYKEFPETHLAKLEQLVAAFDESLLELQDVVPNNPQVPATSLGLRASVPQVSDRV